MRIRALLGIAVVALGAAGCELDLNNPNAPAENEVLGDPEGIVALAIGMQGDFAGAIEDFIQAPALVTDEWGTGTRALIAMQSLLTGENFDASYGVVEAPWANAYEVIRAADALLANAPAAGLPSGVTTGILALAKTYRAMALGMIIQHYPRVVVTIDPAGSPLAERQAVFDTIFALLESARADFAGMTAEERAAFRARVVPAAFDLGATIDAMLARYKLFAARERNSQPLYQEALDAANRVPAGATSMIVYSATNSNPIYALSVVAQYTYPLLSFVAQAQPGDDRPEYWVDVTGPAFTGNPDSLLLPLAKYDTPTDNFPIFVPDEMKLIRAEAHARLGDLATARALVNEVRTDVTVTEADPAAGLPALAVTELDTLDEILREIAYNRRYELYMQGLRWEDSRTLQPYVGVVPVFLYFPLPTQECQENPAVRNEPECTVDVG